MSSSSSSTAKPHVQGCLCDSCEYNVRLSDLPTKEDRVAAGFARNFLSPEAIAQIKVGRVSVPSEEFYAMNPGHLSNMVKHKGKGKKKIVGKCYNTVAGRPQLQRSIREQVITVQMSGQQTAFTTSAVATVYFSNYFTINGFANYAEYTALFDQYRIDEIECWIEPFETQSSVQALCGTFVSAIDLDDANTPTTLAMVQDKQGSITSNGEAGHYHRWKPHVALGAYSGAFSSFANVPAGWIDSASPGVQHYAIKSAITATTNAIPYTLQFKALVSFKNPGI